MFRGSLLRRDDAALNGAKQAAIGRLVRAVDQTGTTDAAEWTLISWALVHGLVVLSREQAVAPLLAAPVDDAGAAAALVERYVDRVFSAGDTCSSSKPGSRSPMNSSRASTARAPVTGRVKVWREPK